MRIGVVGYVGPVRTGIGRYIDEVVTRWRDRCATYRHDVVLFANKDSPLDLAKQDWVERRTIAPQSASALHNLMWTVFAGPRAYREARLDVLFQPNFT